MESNLVCCRTSNEGLNMVSRRDVVGGKSLVRSEMERENEGWKSNKFGYCSVIEIWWHLYNRFVVEDLQ